MPCPLLMSYWSYARAKVSSACASNSTQIPTLSAVVLLYILVITSCHGQCLLLLRRGLAFEVEGLALIVMISPSLFLFSTFIQHFTDVSHLPSHPLCYSSLIPFIISGIMDWFAITVQLVPCFPTMIMFALAMLASQIVKYVNALDPLFVGERSCLLNCARLA